MSRIIYLLCVWLCIGLASAARQTGDWQVLFNGKDLTGWRANHDPAAFTFKDGVLRVQSSSETRTHLLSDFSKVTDRQLNKVVERLNNRPRKTLGDKTPNEVFFKLPLVALTT